MPIPPVEAHTEWFDAGAVRFGVEYRLLTDAIAAARAGARPRAARDRGRSGELRRPRRLDPRRAARRRGRARVPALRLLRRGSALPLRVVARDAATRCCTSTRSPTATRSRGRSSACARACRRCSRARAPRHIAARVDARRVEAVLPRVAEAAYRARYQPDDAACARRAAAVARVRIGSAATRSARIRARARAPGRRRRRPRDRDGAGLPRLLPRLREGSRRRRPGRALRGRRRHRLRRHGAAPVERALRRDSAASCGRRGPSWWSLPAANTLDRATAHLPRLLYERLDDLGIDFAVLYPSRGLTTLSIRDAELRQVACRALNAFNAEIYFPYADRMTPVAQIPTHTPAEAIAELDHAVGRLGFKAIMINGLVHRPIGGAATRADRARAQLGLRHRRAPRHARPRQRARLRPGVAALRRARRRARVAHARHGLGQPALDLELRVQPHRLVRREHGGALQVALPRRRHAALPEPLLRPARGRRRLGVRALRRPALALGEAQPRRDPPPRPGAHRHASCCSTSSRSTATGASAPTSPACASRSRGSSRSRRRSTSAPPAGSRSPRTSRDLFVPRFYFGCEADDPRSRGRSTRA